jgi:hypothetical protein
MAAKPPGKAAAKPKPGVNKPRAEVKQKSAEEKLAYEIKEAFAVWDTGTIIDDPISYQCLLCR